MELTATSSSKNYSPFFPPTSSLSTMQRSAFSQLPKPHELFTSAPMRTPSPQQHSRSRNPSRGGSSTGSQQPNLLVDSSDDNDEFDAPRFRETRSARQSL